MKILRKIKRFVLSFIVWVLVVIFGLPLIFVSWLINKFTPPGKKYAVIAVVGETGSGKSLFKTYLEREMSKQNKKVGSNTNQANLEGVKDTPFECLFKDGKPIYDLSSMGVEMWSFDEIQNQFNNRDFADKSYKSIFDPFVKALSIHRHIQVPKVVFYTQSGDNLDIKIRRLVHKIFEIENTKGLDATYIYDCVRYGKKIDGKKVMRVKRLKGIVGEPQDYENPQHRGYIEAVKKGMFKTEIEIQDLERFAISISKELLAIHNTYQFKDTYSYLNKISIDVLPDEQKGKEMDDNEKELYFENAKG